MENNTYEELKLKNQLCFPLYACAKEIVRAYKPQLDSLDLTYTQYIVMLVLWEKKSCNVKSLGSLLFLDSGTLTPVLKKLESKGYISRRRSDDDERELIVSITNEGDQLKHKAVNVPRSMGQCVGLDAEESLQLYGLIYKVLGNLKSIYTQNLKDLAY